MPKPHVVILLNLTAEVKFVIEAPMPVFGEPQQPFTRKLDVWVHENKGLLLFFLLGGIGFFGMLGGFALWTQGSEKKASELFYKAGQEKDPKKLQALVEQYPRTEAGLLGLAELATLELKNQNWEACIARYETLYKKADHPFFRVLALHGKGSCLRGKKDYKQAVETFERASKEPGHVDPLASLFESARTYQLEGRPEALEKFQALLKEKNLSSQLKTEIEEQTQWLQSQKIKKS